MYNILIVEDNTQLQNEIGILLTRNGFKVIKTIEFDKIPQLVKDKMPHLILLDINLPYQDGFKLCTEIRSFSAVPIIFITSRDTNVDELMSMTLGGDDFVTKPYNAQILIARINALLKRAYPNENAGEVIQYNGVKLNVLSSIVEYENKEVELTKNELKILHYLMVHKGKIVSRMDIMEYLWDSAMFVNDNTLTVNITRLRSKFQEIGMGDFIRTKRGQGYII